MRCPGNVDVVRVVDAHHAYFEAIGAVGPQATATELGETRAALEPHRAPAARIDASDAPKELDHHVEVVDDAPTE